MHPGINGPKLKDKPAIIMAGSGDVITHQELNELSNQGAQLFRSLGLKPGDSMAFMMENHKLFFPIAFACIEKWTQVHCDQLEASSKRS
jgi:acyl-coenzyme A synthetase/AMP-(fatty) acid ligase